MLGEGSQRAVLEEMLIAKEIESYVHKVSEFSDTFVGIVQCAVAEDRSLYFIESNARPPTAAFGMFDDPLAILMAMKNKDHQALSTLLERVNSNGAAIALMHSENTIEVDVEKLSGLEGFCYWPNSVEKESGSFVSYNRGAPSFLHVKGNTIDEIIKRLEQNLPTIEATGNYLAIKPDSIRELYLGQGGASE